MPYTVKTLLMQNAANFQINLGRDCGKVTITAKGECYVRVDATQPTPPAADPTPAGGATADYIHLASSGDTVSFGADPDGRGIQSGLQDPIRWVTGWAKAGADLLVVGH